MPAERQARRLGGRLRLSVQLEGAAVLQAAVRRRAGQPASRRRRRRAAIAVAPHDDVTARVAGLPVQYHCTPRAPIRSRAAQWSRTSAPGLSIRLAHARRQKNHGKIFSFAF